jgi:hypothetical protein
MPKGPRAGLRLSSFALAAVCLAATGCITRTVRETVVDDGKIRVILRGEERGSTPVERGFDHPVTIAPVRLAHILSRIDLQDDAGKDKKRRPAIPTQSLYEVAGALAKGLAAADPSQEVVLLSVVRSKRLAIFDRFYLTSLLVFMQDDLLHVQVARSDWEIPPRRRDNLPEPQAGEQQQSFHLLVDTGMSLAGPQAAVVDWRDSVFAKPTRTRITPGGKVLRTTILMESQEEEAPPAQRPTLSSELTPDQLRSLADLEEARRDGKLSEAEYAAERNRILAPETPAAEAPAPEAPDPGSASAP